MAFDVLLMDMKICRRIVFLFFALALPSFLCAQTPTTSARQFTVVIDAGHGGQDAGAVGSKGYEKNINLDISLLLGKLIEDNCPNVKVYYTRKTDVFVTLQGRADFVNQHHADLFICVHTNASKSPSAYGTETYTLGLHKEESNLEVAKRENSVMLLEDGYRQRYEGFDPNSVDSYIMFEMMQDQYVDKSVQFAQLVQNQFTNGVHRYNRGVRQAGFWVLHKSACPSVLIEVGFISNPQEEAFLLSKSGQQTMATAIFNAFAQYKNNIDRRTAQASVTEKINPIPFLQPIGTTETSVAPSNTSESSPKSSETSETNAQTSQTAEAHSVSYRVQIFVAQPDEKVDAARLKGEQADFYQVGNLRKYTVGDYATSAEAQRRCLQLAAKFPGCFVVKFENGQRVK